ncbi:Cd2+/Zn2+-exporting ATPase [Polaromonas sp. OV174]|uniref:heavy metal translocating P-type ATPase n=1 Tax=Polaromonas sp. OV174 TaxID=1855300 RepID=UPI0008E9C5B0|nr:heavy metal translocating P-type ATPase [Polaromonas sp. OV174]SFB75471.1 Cd2+/Zn2+-exporting ATPase [Polaromonas sp. OV174]
MKTETPHSSELSACGSTACCAPTQTSTSAPASAGAGGQLFRIATMDCSAEESEIRQALEPIAGIRSLGFQLGARTLKIEAADEAYPLALAAIRQAGFDPRPMVAGAAQPPADGAHGHSHDHDHDHGHAGGSGLFGSGMGRFVLALVLATGAELLSYFAPDATPWKVAGMAVAALAIWLAGIDTYKKGIAALLRGKLNINALMSVAVTGAFAIGQWPEAAMVMALYAIAEWLEAKAVDRARNAIKGLLELAPAQALTRQPDGAWVLTPVAAVPLQATVRIKPGERLPLDGIVIQGNSAINQAPITGESMPVDKAPGDAVFAGTINETGELEVRITKAASDTTLARIIHAVEQAQGTRAPTQRFVDRFAAAYTPVIFAIAVAVAVLTPLLMGLSWQEAAYKALVLLVIACPCALVISTPVTVVSGLSAAARRGILIKGGTYLEEARLLKAVALDKTGTITEGKPKLVDWRVWGDGDEAQLKQAACSLAARSDHPVSKAIAASSSQQPGEVQNFTALPGRGVQGRVGGQDLLLGNHRLMHERGCCSPELEAELALHEQQGRSVTLLADKTRVLALFAVADTIKASSIQAIADLKALGVAPVMLTGDNSATAQAIAAQAGIGDARGDLLPEAKLEAIKEMQQRYGATGMTGDGINDAPALAQADIGFAMGGAGTDTAMEAADVVIMNDNLQRVAETVRLSQRTHSILWQNISLALGIKSVFLLLAVFGTATMWMAVFADMGASLLVVANGLRLLRGAAKAAGSVAPQHDHEHGHAH